MKPLLTPKLHVDVPVIPKLKPLWKPMRYKVLYGGRGGAKTEAVAEYLVVQSLLGKKRILCTREVQKSLKQSVFKVIETKIETLKLSAYFEVGESKITSITGSEFIFEGLHTNVDSIKSMQGVDICWVEEAQSISRNSLDILTPTIRKAGSEIVFTFNPEDEDDPVYADYVVNPPANAWVVKINFNENPYFPKELEAERLNCLERNPDNYEWIWEGELRKISDAQIFKGIFELKAFETPSNARFYHGVDWGFSEDPAVLIRCFVQEGDLFIDTELYKKGLEIDDLPQFVRQVPSTRNWPLFADDARPDLIKHLKRRGFNIRKTGKWQGSIMDGINYIRNFRKVYIHPRCPETFNEFNKYSYKQDRNTGEVIPQPVDKFNHTTDCVRYALCKRIKKGVNNADE